ncbi:MAG TPA: carboxymuconolactone decarboxylase family protein [Candidatus Saccharimonadales bacterium]|nr:carboxymuconolactone decarboxylase family protein [Candidatus Saccharimonadales bacterium]
MAQPSDHNEQFRQQHPKVWGAFAKLADECHDEGPLDEKSRKLVKVALAIGAGLEGATHSAVRHALDAGVTPAELEHLTVLAITTLGYPSAMRALSWVHDQATQPK